MNKYTHAPINVPLEHGTIVYPWEQVCYNPQAVINVAAGAMSSGKSKCISGLQLGKFYGVT